MDFSKIYNVTLYANSTTDKIFVEQISDIIKTKTNDFTVLWYYDDSQIPLVEAPLNNWRRMPAETNFTWPFIVYKYQNSLGTEYCEFKEGVDAVTEFSNS
jgi:hypothetical protein